MSESPTPSEDIQREIKSFQGIVDEALEIYKTRYPEFQSMWTRFPINELYLYTIIKLRRSSEFYKQGNYKKAREDYLDSLNIMLFVGSMMKEVE